ncbi:PR-1-like protein [Trametes sanguinea]|nr:PR-1-like protein [Trametes sanguinea]
MKVSLGYIALFAGALISVATAAPAVFHLGVVPMPSPASPTPPQAVESPSSPADPSPASPTPSVAATPSASSSDVVPSQSSDVPAESSSAQGTSTSLEASSSISSDIPSASNSVPSGASSALSATTSEGPSSVSTLPASTPPTSTPEVSSSRPTPSIPITTPSTASSTGVAASSGSASQESSAFSSASAVVSSSSFTPPTSTPSNPVAAPSPTVGPVERQAYLDQHNDVRGKFGAQPLVWSDDLQAKAQSYAENCQLRHSDGANGPVGENLAAATGVFDTTAAVKLFVRDMGKLDQNPNNFVFSHFTQVVWKSTTQLGCGVALCDGILPGRRGPATYHVCLYDPVGNVIGQEKENLPL